MNSFLEIVGMIVGTAFVFALVGYMLIGFAVGVTWPFWMFT